MSESAGDGFVKYLLENACKECGATIGHSLLCPKHPLARPPVIIYDDIVPPKKKE